jgi:hypothetical protein
MVHTMLLTLSGVNSGYEVKPENCSLENVANGRSIKGELP